VYLEQDPGGGDGMLFLAYQAQGLRDGEAVTLNRASVSFGEPIPNAERFESGDCVGFRAKGAAGIVFPARDAGELRITGADGDFRCRIVGGTYRCDMPETGGFFSPGAELGLRSGGGGDLAGFSSAVVRPARAPVPSVDLATLASAAGDVRVGWEPSRTPVPMTCLTLETLASDGRVNGYVQCDVEDAMGEAVVPAGVAAALDRSAPVTRVSLFSVGASETVGRDGRMRAVYFGQGRFSEVVRSAPVTP
jgi:hypothetical protein